MNTATSAPAATITVNSTATPTVRVPNGVVNTTAPAAAITVMSTAATIEGEQYDGK